MMRVTNWRTVQKPRVKKNKGQKWTLWCIANNGYTNSVIMVV